MNLKHCQFTNHKFVLYVRFFETKQKNVWSRKNVRTLLHICFVRTFFGDQTKKRLVSKKRTYLTPIPNSNCQLLPTYTSIIKTSYTSWIASVVHEFFISTFPFHQFCLFSFTSGSFCFFCPFSYSAVQSLQNRLGKSKRRITPMFNVLR